MSMLEKMAFGAAGPSVSRLGMGCWAIGGHGWGIVNDEDSIRAVNCALDSGVDFFDTADAYGLGKSETLLAEILGPKRHDVVIATKGGVRWDDAGKVWTDISPGYLRVALENSLRRLKIEAVPLYYIHKPDGVTCIKESVAALESFRQEGKIQAIGVANFSPEQLQQALEITQVSALQVRLNLFEWNVLNRYSTICETHNVSLVAWGVLADGLLTGKYTSGSVFSNDDHRSRMADFTGGTFEKNLHCVSLLTQLADERGVTLSQLALRWVLDSSEIALPLFGAKTDVQVKENMGAMGWRLTVDEIESINRIVEKFRGGK